MTSLAVMVLAAGFGRRFEGGDKLTAPLDGKPILSYVFDLVLAAPFEDHVLVVNDTAAGAVAVDGAAEFRTIVNDQASEGIGASIACGARALKNASGVAIFLGDMPFIHPETIKRLMDAFIDANNSSAIIAPSFHDRRGHPVIFGANYFSSLTKLAGDKGANAILETNREDLTLVAVDDPGVIRDIDTREDLAGV